MNLKPIHKVASLAVLAAALERQGDALHQTPLTAPGNGELPRRSYHNKEGDNDRWSDHQRQGRGLMRRERLDDSTRVGSGNSSTIVARYLGSDIPYNKCSSSWMTCLVDMDYLNETRGHIQINGQLFSRGIVDHAPGYAMFTLGGEFSLFRSCVGISKYASDPKCGVTSGAAKFRVLGDGAVLRKWLAKGSPQDASCIDVDITGVQELMLETDLDFGRQHCTFSTWAEARVEKADSPSLDPFDWVARPESRTTPTINGFWRQSLGGGEDGDGDTGDEDGGGDGDGDGDEDGADGGGADGGDDGTDGEDPEGSDPGGGGDPTAGGTGGERIEPVRA
mmetsp:Transcript_10415/g.18420  ORF Transcript_10415/g.18420 Transcript_10415/m.18420 type:complete len:335 (-) Transcript_10415:55-1059(-)